MATDRVNMNNFAPYMCVSGCGNFKITDSAAACIAKKHFPFTGLFYGSGTFDTVTTAHGTCELNNFYIGACGHAVSGGTHNWTAAWQDSSQPVSAMVGNPEPVMNLPDTETSGFGVDINRWVLNGACAVRCTFKEMIGGVARSVRATPLR